MATVKNCTDLDQSRKLAEFLPLESADMYWWCTSSRCYIEPMHIGDFYEEKGHIRAWSLAALLNIIRKLVGYSLQSLDTHTVFMICELGDKPYAVKTNDYDNPIDACVAMIEKLHELEIL